MCLNLIGEHNILHEELYKSFTQTSYKFSSALLYILLLYLTLWLH